MGFFRSLFIFIDSVVYGILEQIFQLIINLANFDLFSGNVLKEFSTRIYLILGLVMVFKLILSFIQMLIDPNRIDDKENGVFNILKRVVISMILIVLVPSIFTFAKQLQNQVIPIIPKVVLGVPVDVDSSLVASDATTTDPLARQEDENGNVMVSTGRLMAYYSFLPFFYYNDGCEGLKTLNGTTDGTPEISSVAEAFPHVNDKNGCSTTDDGYDYNYRMIVSTLVGAYLVYVLVTVALQIATRTIKFGICQLIAPIPIASYIDPSASKKAFDNWVSTSIKVYLDLFVRLIVVYFVIYIFRLLFDGERFFEILGKYGAFQGLLVALFIITGLLNFVKEMPKFVTGMLGLPDGFSDIGDMFRGQGFRAIRDTVQMGTNPLTVGVGNAINTWRHNENTPLLQRLRRTAGSAVAGGVSASVRSNLAVLGGHDVGEAARIGRERAIAARRNRANDDTDDITWRDRARVGMQEYFGIDTEVGIADDQSKGVSAVRDAWSKYKSAANGRKVKELNLGFRNGQSRTLDNIGQILERNRDAIEASGNNDLINFYNSLQRQDDGHYRVREGYRFGVHDIDTYSKVATQLGLALGGQLSNPALINAADRELFEDSKYDRAVDNTGIFNEDHRIRSFGTSGQGNIDLRLSNTAINEAIRKNAAAIGEVTIVNRNRDTGQIITDADGNATYRTISGAEALIDAASYQMADLDDALGNINERLSQTISGSNDAIIRESRNRRRQNNQNG